MQLWQLALVWGVMAIALLILVVILIRRLLAGRVKRTSVRHAQENAAKIGRPVNAKQPYVRKRQLSEGLVIAEPEHLRPVVDAEYYAGLEQRLESAFNDYLNAQTTLEGFEAVVATESDDVARRQAAILAQPPGIRGPQLEIIASAQEALSYCANWVSEQSGTSPSD